MTRADENLSSTLTKESSASDAGTPANRNPDARLVMSVAEAGAALGLGRNSSYAAAARGDIPTIRIGGLIKVPCAAFYRKFS
jgi:hypothetical protein